MADKNRNGTKLALTVFGTSLLTTIVLVAIWALTKDTQQGDCVPGPGPSTTTPMPSPYSTHTPSTTVPPTSPAPATTPSPPQPSHAHDQFVRTNVSKDSVLHVWFRAAREGQSAQISARKSGDQPNNGTALVVATSSENDEHWFDYREFAFDHEGQLELCWWSGNTIVSYLYAFEPERVQEEGIRVLYISQEAKRPPAKDSFHLRAPAGWSNDPCGFSRSSDGLYHVFYQNNPISNQWFAMHWGHAVSKDLIHWVHQPIFLRPTDKSQKFGGIFTGSATQAKDGGLRVYYTDHNDERHPKEFQQSVLTKDMYRTMGPARDAFANVPTEVADQLTDDFRDPNVFTGPDGKLFMTTSSRLRNGTAGVVMLFRQDPDRARDGPEGWEFKGIIRQDPRWKMEVCECSGLIPLGDPRMPNTLWALIYAMQNCWDEDGRQDLNIVVVGTFDGEKFVPRFEQMLDFATGSYAFQGFYDPVAREPLLIGWLANWHDYDRKNAFPTSLTLPRVLKLSPGNNFLMTPPHPSVANLRAKELGVSEFRIFKKVQLPEKGTVEIDFEVYFWRLRVYGPLKLEMNQRGKGQEGRVTLIIAQDGLEMVLGWKNSTEHRFIERAAKVNSLQIFIDVGSVEVFSDQGQWTGTARIPDEGRMESVQLSGNHYALNADSARMWSLKSTQPETPR